MSCFLWDVAFGWHNKMVISNSNSVRYRSSVKIPPAFTKGRCILLHCYAWHSGGCRTSSPWSSDHNDRIHECKGTGYGMKYWPAHREGAEHSPGLGIIHGVRNWRQDGRSEAALFWVGREQVQWVPYHLVLGWKDGVWPTLHTCQRAFCERKPSPISDMPAINQCGILQQCQTSPAPSEGGKRGLAQPEIPCTAWGRESLC